MCPCDVPVKASVDIGMNVVEVTVIVFVELEMAGVC